MYVHSDGSFQASAALLGLAFVLVFLPEHALTSRGFNKTGRTFLFIYFKSSYILISMCCSNCIFVLRSRVSGLGVRQQGSSESDGAD